MNRPTVDLGFILRQAPDFEFDMDEFDGRLRLQKFIYLLQAHGVYLGYDFSWYLRGPYCSALTTCGFALRDIYDEIPENAEARFLNSGDQRNFKKFLEFVKGREMDHEYLEIAASIHMLKNLGRDDSGIIGRVMEKSESFTKEKCDKIWDDLIEHDLLPQRGVQQ